MEDNFVFTLDDRHEIFNMYKSQCSQCQYFQRDGYCCVAFPEQIPEEILLGDQTHEEVYKGQKGSICFTPKV